MKASFKTIAFFLLLTTPLISFDLNADEPLSPDLRAIEVQRNLIAPKPNFLHANVDVEIRITFPDYPSIKPISFNKRVNMPYTLSSKTILINGGDIPVFYRELTNIPKGLKPITVAIKGTEGDVARITWNENKDVKASGLDFVVRIYQRGRYEITDAMRAAIEFTLPDIEMNGTNVDDEDQSVTLAFDSALPKTNNQIFNEFLAGKRVHGEVTVQLVNPFE